MNTALLKSFFFCIISIGTFCPFVVLSQAEAETDHIAPYSFQTGVNSILDAAHLTGYVVGMDTVNFNAADIDNPRLSRAIAHVLIRKGILSRKDVKFEHIQENGQWIPGVKVIDNNQFVSEILEGYVKSIKNTFYDLVSEKTGLKFPRVSNNDYYGVGTLSTLTGKPSASLSKESIDSLNNISIKELYTKAVVLCLESKTYGDSPEVHWHVTPYLIKQYPLLQQNIAP